MKTKLLLTLAAWMFASAAVLAVPAKRVTKTVRLDNGTTVELTLRGDEHFSFYTDASGNPYKKTMKGKYERLTTKEVDSLWTLRKSERMQLSQTASSTRRNMPIRRAGTPSPVTTGNQKGLVILMEFQDVKFVTQNPKAVFNRFFNEEGYNDYNNAGSVKDYFLRQSYGKLNITFDVVGPYSTSKNMAYYRAATENKHDVRPAHMVAEAIDAARSDVNFANYDWDGDGEVDQVFVVYAGYNQAQGADSTTIWPHEWTLEADGLTRTYNGKTIRTYGCSSELMGDGVYNTGILDGIGTACHEFSHCLGLPDMYDTSTNNFGMGDWDVMCSGSYNDNNTSHTPAGYTSYERMFAGWLTPTEIKTMTRINDMKPLATDAEAYILYNEKNRNEYYLLENRQPVGFDRGLPGHGLLIVHVDYDEGAWTSNAVNTISTWQRMTIIPADNQLYPTNSNMAGDPWPGTTGNTALTNFTSPAATLYSNNVDGTKFMSKNIDNITENTSNHTVSFVVCRPEMDVPTPNDGTEVSGASSFTVEWPAVSGAIGYELELTKIGGVPTNPTEALEREYDFDKCYSKTAGFSDIGTKMSNYGLSGWTGESLFTSPNKLRFGTSTKTGYLRTATWQVPESTDMTIVMGADVFKAGTPVKGTLIVKYGNSGETAASEEVAFEVTGDNKLVFHFNIKKDLFWIEIHPNAQMYLNYLAVYNGTWTAEQLGYASSAAKPFGPLYANETTYYSTSTNSYTFENLNTTSRYVYRVRAKGDENIYSQWSSEKTFTFSTTGIQMMPAEATESRPDAIYDLNGRYVGTDLNALQKGIYIFRGKKVVK